jgi:hypothetical protein
VGARSIAAIEARAGLAIWLRREPTTDTEATRGPQAWRFGILRPRFCDVVAYRAPPSAGGVPSARWPWHQADKPRKGCRRVVLNCFTWRAVWLPDLKG